MEIDPGTMEEWRKCFRSAGKDIFEVVEHAILVAAADSPSEFRLRRDRIAELLYTCHLARQRGVSGGVVGNDDDEEEQEEEEMMKRDFTPGEKERKVDSSDGLRSEVNRTVSNYSYDEAEALTEEMEEESQIVGEVLRIRELLCNHDESDSVLFESLRRLQLMSLSVETLKATEIGRAVNGLRKRNSKQIRHLARTLIDGWKVLVDEWVSATAAIADNSPESVNPSTLDEEDGLPSPPLDEGAFLATQNTNIQLSEFFDGIDDDGNFRNSGDREDHVIDSGRKVGEYGVKQNYDRRHIENHKPMQEHKQKQQQQQQQQPGGWATAEGKLQNKIQEPVVRKQSVALSGQANPHGTTNKQNKLAVADSGPGRPARQSLEQKQIGGAKPRQQDLSGAQRNPPNVLQDKSKYSEEASERAKLEAAKRRLHERYQEAENAKKQRTIQVMELQDIPKQAHNHRPPFTKPKGNIRSWANTRR